MNYYKGYSKTIFVFLFVLVGLCNNVDAMSNTADPEYKGAIIYDAQGPVKEIKIKTKNPLATNKKIKFSKDGKINNDLMTYNQDGYPIGFGMNFGNRSISLTIEYNDEQLPYKMIEESRITTPGIIDVENLYDEFKCLTSRKAMVSNDKEECRLTFEYSCFIYDEHGNWISRHVVQTTLKDSDSEVLEYEESRNITYYP